MKKIGVAYLDPLDNEVYFDEKTNSNITKTWDFYSSNIKKWLDKNCKNSWTWSWGDENNKEQMKIYIYFEDEIDYLAWKLYWE